MKPAELKREFVKLRAAGNSYSKICEQLRIAKGTCTKWEQEFAAEIDELRRAEIAELYESYGMAKTARIKNLGDTLAKIDEAISKADFSEVDPARLLDFKLRYTEALKGEYVANAQPLDAKNVNAQTILAAITDLLNRSRAGDITAEQARREGDILASLLKAFDATELQRKLDELTTIVGGRN